MVEFYHIIYKVINKNNKYYISRSSKLINLKEKKKKKNWDAEPRADSIPRNI